MAIEIKIGASFNDKDIKRAQRELQNLANVQARASESMSQKFSRIGQSMQSFGQSLTTHVTAPLVAIGALSVKAFTEQEDAIAKMEATLRATGGVAGVTSDHIKGLASQLQDTTTFADEVTVNGAALLLTFKGIRNEMGAGNDVFDRTIKASQDLSALMGTDLNSSVMMLGKALQDPAAGMSRLTRAGIQFTDQQKQQIRTLAASGDMLGAQKIMLQEIESQFGGTAEAMAGTASGRLKQAMNQLGEAGETIGAALAPAIEKVAGFIAGLGEGLASMPGPLAAIVVGLGAVVAAAGPVIWAAGGVLSGFSQIMAIDWKRGFGRAVEAVQGMSSAIQGGMSQALNAFRNMSTGSKVALGGVTAALVAAGFALNYFVNEQAENAKKRFKTLGVSVDSLRTSFQLLVSDNTLVGGLEDLPTILKDIQSETEGAYNWFVRLRASGENGEIGFASGWFTDVDDNANKARESLAAWDQQLASTAAESTPKAIAQFQALQRQAESLGYSLPIEMFPQLKSEIETAAAEAGISVPEFMDLAGAGGEIKTEFELATEALQEWEDEVRSQFDPLFAYGDSMDSLADAQRRQEEAAWNALGATAQYGAGSYEAEKAARDYEASIRDTTSATFDTAFQLERLKEGLRTGAVDFITASQHLDGLVASGLMTEEQARLTKDEWARLADQVNTTPSYKQIMIDSNASTVLDHLRNLKAIMDDPTRTTWGKVRALVEYSKTNNADGGPVMAGRAGWVGERGPELFIPNVDGTIVPHYQSRRIMDELGRGSQPQQVVKGQPGTVNVYVNKTDASPYDIGRELLWQMKVAS